MNRSLDALLALASPSTVMVFGHDPGQWGETRGVLPDARLLRPDLGTGLRLPPGRQ